jgi:dTDP-4-amino-4,6-dideoxygalactose transaminase
MSPFFMTIKVNSKMLNGTKLEFANALEAEGIPVNKDYRYVVAEWSWLKPYLEAGSATPNATALRNTSFNILFHEAFRNRDIRSIVEAMVKVEKTFLR